MFLPEALEDQLRRTLRSGPLAGPLVAEEIMLVRADRAAPLRHPPRFAPWLALVGAGIAGVVILFGRLAAKGVVLARVALGAWLAAFGLVSGLLGWCFVLLWAVTNHDVAHHNENLLECAPFALLMVIPAIRLACGRVPGKLIRHVCILGAANSLLGFLVKALPWFNQDNGQAIAIFLPLWAGSAWAVQRLWERDRADNTPSPSTALAMTASDPKPQLK
jgi:hypothetical protein